MFRTHFIYIFIYLSIPLKLQPTPPCPPSERLWLQFSGFPARNTVQYIWLVLFEYMWQPLIVIMCRWFASHSITGLHRLLATCHVAHSCESTSVLFTVRFCSLFLDISDSDTSNESCCSVALHMRRQRRLHKFLEESEGKSRWYTAWR